MFFPEARVRVFVHGRPVDLRKSFTGLIALTTQALAQDPVEVIALPNPNVAGLAPNEYEVIGEKVTHRLAACRT